MKANKDTNAWNVIRERGESIKRMLGEMDGNTITERVIAAVKIHNPVL